MERTFQKHFLTIDKSNHEPNRHSEETEQALNQFSLHTKLTPASLLDLRCEYDVPRFCDLTSGIQNDENLSF